MIKEALEEFETNSYSKAKDRDLKNMETKFKSNSSLMKDKN